MNAPHLLTGILGILGGLLAGTGALGLVAGRRFARHIQGDPYHREGDALAAYLPGCSACMLALGLLMLAGVGWAWLRGVGAAP